MYRCILSFSLQRSARWALGTGLFFSIALFASIYELEQSNNEAKFERRAQARASSVEHGMISVTEALASLNHMFVIAGGDVSRESFHSITYSLLGRYPAIDSFALTRRISKTQRADYEALMRLDYPGFSIQEIAGGKRVVAPERERYRVIDYVEPASRRAAVFGINTSSTTFMDEAMQLAEDTGRPALSGVSPLFRDEKEMGIRSFMPVYRGGMIPTDIVSRRQAVTGYTVAVLRANALFEEILRSAAGALGNADLDIRIYAADTDDETQLAYRSASKAADSRQKSGFLPSLHDGLEPFTYHFIVGGRPWYIEIESMPTPFFPTHTVAVLSFMLSLLITLGITGYMHFVGVRRQRIEELVALRTQEIHELNSRLKDDIKAREQVEKVLASNQERARDMAEMSSDWYWEQDENFRYVKLATDVLGEKEVPESKDLPPGILGATRWELPVDLEASDWAAHRALLEAHLPFRDFEFKSTLEGTAVQWISISGKPLFDAEGNFKGYHGTAKNITDRKQAEEALSRSRSDLRKLADHMNQVKEDERKRIARDIHDDLGQSLMALRIDVSLTAKYPNLPMAVKESLAGILGQIDTVIKAIRNIINDLRPGVLDLGLHAAVEWQAKEFARRTGIDCDVYIDHEEFALEDKQATALFRIVQEVLNNIHRHANATQVRIELLRSETSLEMCIEDNGIGFSAECRRKANSFGLVGIEERVRMLDGRFSIKGSPGKGTRIFLSVPFPAGELSAENRANFSPV